MMASRVSLWLLARLESATGRESLVGDLIEELANGRSRWWLWQQMVGMCVAAVIGQTTGGTRLMSSLLTFAPSAIIIVAVLVAPYGAVLQTWTVIYMVTGTLSLFGHLIASSSFNSRALALPENTK